MFAIRPVRGLFLSCTLSLTVWALGCDAPTQVQPDSDALLIAAAAPGGNGGGKGKPGSQGPEHTISLTGEMTTPEGPQLAVLETDSKNKLEINGWRDIDCTDPDDPPASSGTCFRNELHLVVVASSCQLPGDMTAGERDVILGVLDDSPPGASSQARTKYEVDVSKRHGTALIREFFYEAGDATRYNVLVHVDAAAENPLVAGEWTFTGGLVQVSYDPRGPIDCPWSGSFVMTIGDADPQPPDPT